MPALGLWAEADLASSVCCTAQRPRAGIFRHIQSITYKYRLICIVLYLLYICEINFLTTLLGMLLVFKWRFIYIFLMFLILILQPWREARGLGPETSGHTGWMTVVAPSYRPKSVRISCVIERFYIVFVLLTHFLSFMGVRDTTASNLYPFLFRTKSNRESTVGYSNWSSGKSWRAWENLFHQLNYDTHKWVS